MLQILQMLQYEMFILCLKYTFTLNLKLNFEVRVRPRCFDACDA